jgi:hypothetical protein
MPPSNFNYQAEYLRRFVIPSNYATPYKTSSSRFWSGYDKTMLPSHNWVARTYTELLSCSQSFFSNSHKCNTTNPITGPRNLPQSTGLDDLKFEQLNSGDKHDIVEPLMLFTGALLIIIFGVILILLLAICFAKDDPSVEPPPPFTHLLLLRRHRRRKTDVGDTGRLRASSYGTLDGLTKEECEKV